MRREDIPIKTCDEIRDSIKGCPTPCNENEHVVGNTIYETFYSWQSHGPSIGQIERRTITTGWGDEGIRSYYVPSARARSRLETFLEELQGTGYAHKDIRDAWSSLLTKKMFTANAYIYDDSPADFEALDDERRFIAGLIHHLELLKKARDKAITRLCRKVEEKGA